MPGSYDEKKYCDANEPQRRPDLQCNPSQAYTYYQSQACVENDPYWEEYWQGHEERLRTGGAPQTPSPEAGSAPESANAQEAGSAQVASLEEEQGREHDCRAETDEPATNNLNQTEGVGGEPADMQANDEATLPSSENSSEHVQKKSSPKYVKITSKKVEYKVEKKVKTIPDGTIVELITPKKIKYGPFEADVLPNQYTEQAVISPKSIVLQTMQFNIGDEAKTIAKVTYFDKPSRANGRPKGNFASNTILKVLEVKVNDEVNAKNPNQNIAQFEGYSNKKAIWYLLEDAKGTSGYVTGDYLEKVKVSKEITQKQRDVVVHNADSCLNQVTRDMVKSNFEDFNSGDYNRNCANFVSYMLRTAGVLNKNIGSCKVLRKELRELGWGVMSVKNDLIGRKLLTGEDGIQKAYKVNRKTGKVDNATAVAIPQAGDVWFDEPEGGHTEIVKSIKTDENGIITHIILIGSNNNGNVQVVTQVENNYGVIYSRYFTK